MKRWFTNLPIMRKLFLCVGLVSPLVLGMVIIDVKLGIQEAGIVAQFAHHPGVRQLAAEMALMQAISQQLMLYNLLLGGFIIALGCLCAFVMGRMIVRPLEQVRLVARLASSVWLMELADGLVALAQGEWSVSVSKRELPSFYASQDEIGQIGRSLHKMMSTIQNMSDIYEVTRQELQNLYTHIQEQNEELSVANEHLNSLATTDPLTGLPNHRAIMDHIDKEVAQCQTTQRNCAIIFVDVDHFKGVNDIWGHGAGDAVLRSVGQKLRDCVRQEDYVGRYGGEEFAILLADIEQHEAFEMAERLRNAIAERPYIWEVNETQSSVAIPLTASFGLAVYPLDGVTRKELIERADAAMYVAKHSGRNRVCLPDEEAVNAEVSYAEVMGEEIPHEEVIQGTRQTRSLETLATA